MSIESILEATISSIKNFIEKILPSSKKLLDLALIIVNGIKTFADSSVTDIITVLIPGDVDDHIKELIRKKLPAIMIDLKLASSEANKVPEEIVKDGIASVQSMSVNVKSVTLQSIWQLLSNEITQSGINLTNLQKIGQTYYEQSKAKSL